MLPVAACALRGGVRTCALSSVRARTATAFRAPAVLPGLGFAPVRWLTVGTPACDEAADGSDTAAAPRRKFKNRFKRASTVMADIKNDAYERMKITRAKQRGASIPHFDVGDAVQVRYSYELADPKPALIKGIVIAKRNKGVDSKFTIMNAVDDDIITMTFPFSSPLLKEVKMYKKWHLHNGRKRCRKAKLYYLIDKPVEEWRVK